MVLVPYVVCRDDNMSRSYDIFSRMLRDRAIMLTGQIDDNLADLVIAQLLHLQAENQEAEIYIYVNSPGGSVTSALAIYDVMRYIRPNVTTICVGQACSAASLLLCAGDKRLMTQHARILLHQPSAGFSGQASDLKIQVAEIGELYRIIKKIYQEHTFIPDEELDKLLDRDTILRSEEALELGLVDEVVAPRKATDKATANRSKPKSTKKERKITDKPEVNEDVTMQTYQAEGY